METLDALEKRVYALSLSARIAIVILGLANSLWAMVIHWGARRAGEMLTQLDIGVPDIVSWFFTWNEPIFSVSLVFSFLPIVLVLLPGYRGWRFPVSTAMLTLCMAVSGTAALALAMAVAKVVNYIVVSGAA
jgi:hypothetical protein